MEIKQQSFWMRAMRKMHNKLSAFIEKYTPIINEQLNQLMDQLQTPEPLKSSMQYSVNAGGKRVRPLLILAALNDLDIHHQDAIHVACAVEFIHTYSLIHDDLPCMDDDDYRRGKLTNHKVYGEAIAVLSGDALQTLAFHTIAQLSQTKPQIIVSIIKCLATTSGANGMVGGQVLDMEGEEKALSIQELEKIHMNKTGALLSFCLEAAALLAELDTDKTHYLKEYAHHIGLAFQIKDDILDITSTTDQLGKSVGSDVSSEKATYPAILGMEGAMNQLHIHHQQAKESLRFLNKDLPLLSLFADYIVERNS
jgi:geranylgeranyl diphosphate synthase type II